MKENVMLKQERQNRQWTQIYVAQKVGVTKQTVCDWEKGRRFPRRDVLEKLENLFHLTYRELFAPVTDENPFSLPNNESH